MSTGQRKAWAKEQLSHTFAITRLKEQQVKNPPTLHCVVVESDDTWIMCEANILYSVCCIDYVLYLTLRF